MAKVTRFFGVIRRNWKKSLFGASVLAYGANYGKNYYDTKQLMREYCELAAKYGDTPNIKDKPYRRITVILNPAANKRKAKDMFKKYCAPLLHLAGLAVVVVQTEYAGHAREIIEKLDPKSDAIVIAGGDGTLSEIITGLLRRVEGNPTALKNLPMGILPLGRTNSISLALLGEKDHVRALADATMAVIDGSLKTVDAIKIEPLDETGEGKPVYSLARVEWGAFRDAQVKKDKYWYFGKLRDYVTYLFSKPQEDNWKCVYIEPCNGCSKCVRKSQGNPRWWNMFIPRSSSPEKDYSTIKNENCGELKDKEFSCVEICIQTSTVSSGGGGNGAPHLTMTIGPDNLSWFGFVSEGWRRLLGRENDPAEVVELRQIQLMKKEQKKEEDWLSIDSEDFEVRPMKISLVPETVNLFLPRVSTYVKETSYFD